MESPAKRKIRDLIGHRSVNQSPATVPMTTVDAVGDAEQIVGDAWIQVLVGYRDQAEAAAHTAFEHCDAARRRLAEAGRAGDPRRLAIAHTELEQTLAAAERAANAYDHACQGLILELDLLAGKAAEHAVEHTVERALKARIAHDGAHDGGANGRDGGGADSPDGPDSPAAPGGSAEGRHRHRLDRPARVGFVPERLLQLFQRIRLLILWAFAHLTAGRWSA